MKTRFFACFLFVCLTAFAGHMQSDGKGGFWLPNGGGHVETDGRGGFWLPSGGGHVESDGKGGFWLPNK